MAETFELMPVWAFFASLAVAGVAGYIKGAIGFGMPLVLVSGLSLFLEPSLAIAGLIAPTVLSNLIQAGRHGLARALEVVQEYRRYITMVCVMILISAQFVTRVEAETFYLIVGVPITLLSVIQLLGVSVRIPENRRNVTDLGVGTVAGALGGFSGTWGPPTALYLLAIGTPKQKSILVQGVVYALGSLGLVAGHLQSGVITVVTLPFTLTLLVPALIGQWIGFRTSDRLDPELFRRATLLLLLVAGLNLLRRALF